MKVLIICNSSSGLLSFRGMLIQKLISLGNSVEAVVPFTDNAVENSFETELEHIGCTLHRTAMERRGMNPLKDTRLIRSFRKVINSVNPDLVITYTIKPNVYGGLICRLLRIPYVVNITGLGTAFQCDGVLKKIVVQLYKLGTKKAKVIFFENVDNKNVFTKLKIVEESKTCVLNGAGVDVEKYYYSPYPDENQDIRFLFIGRVMQEKGIDELYQAAEKVHSEFDNIHIDIVGYYEDNYREKTEELCRNTVIEYHGFQKDVRPFIENSHCFVLPSWHEGMANTNLECASMGRPLITSNIHGCKEAVVENGSGFLCEPKNATSLYKQIKRFIELPYKNKVEMGKKARKHIEENFDKRIIVDKTIKEIFK